MATDPNKKIEEMLKAYAQQRRSEVGGEFTLHPATRGLLQSEVKHTFSGEGRRASSRFIFWPRLALIGGFTAMLVVTVMILNTPKKANSRLGLAQRKLLSEPVELRPNESSRDKEALPKRQTKPSDLPNEKFFATAPAPASTPPPAQSRNEFNKSDGAVATRKISPEELSSKQLGAFKKVENSTIVSSPLAPKTKNKIAENCTATDSISQLASTNSLEISKRVESNLKRNLAWPEWKFVQQNTRSQYRENLLSPKLPKILRSFQLERSGNQIRLHDIDGSIYSVEILPQANGAGGRRDSIRNENFSFQVAGTNRLSKRLVSFAGELTQTNLVFPTKAPARAGELKQESRPEIHFIHGKVSVNGTNEFEMRAIESPQ